jgi:RNA polymerase sigma-70 factor (ECF subfamily)
MERAICNSSDRQVMRLLRQARGGSKEALGQVLEEFRNRLATSAQRLLPADLRSKGDAADLVQESLLDAYRNFDSFRGNSTIEFYGWLRRILRNRMSKFARTFRTEKRNLHREKTLSGTGHPNAACGPIPAPDDVVLHKEQAEVLVRAMDRLPAYYREVVELRHRFELQFADVANLLGKSEFAVRRAWARSLGRLREELEAIEFASDARHA